ncbi:hypothetical protein AVEN_272836-1, partial [Araneus ventricosus]
ALPERMRMELNKYAIIQADRQSTLSRIPIQQTDTESHSTSQEPPGVVSPKLSRILSQKDAVFLPPRG